MLTDYAFNKPADQSSTHRPKNTPNRFAAGNAVKETGDCVNWGITHTKNEDYPWWKVDLKGHVMVSEVSVKPRKLDKGTCNTYNPNNYNYSTKLNTISETQWLLCDTSKGVGSEGNQN